MDRDERIERAQEQPASADTYRPTDLRLDKKDGLRIEWADGHASHYPLSSLRKHCPCATCRQKGAPEQTHQSSTSLTVLPANIDRATEFTHAELVGNYAMRIIWADGHDSGIYDFRYLRMIGRESEPRRAEPRP